MKNMTITREAGTCITSVPIQIRAGSLVSSR